MSDVRELKFHRPMVNTGGLDWIFAYPLPTSDSPFNLTPLSILFPGKMQEDAGCTVEYWDARWDPPEMLDDYIKEAKNIGVSAFTGYQCGHAADILERAKKLNPKIITHLGGHHARLCTEDVRKEPFVDQVWPERSYHEHSFPFSKAAQRLWKRGDWQHLTSSGCPYSCTFCALRSQWAPRDLKQLAQEINAVYDLTGFKEISFCDPNIGYHKYKADGVTHHVDRVERMREIGKILRPLGIRWDGNVRSDYITPEYVEAMAWSGCYSIEFGCESGNEEFLRKVIKKGHGIDAIKNANTYMHGSGISVMNSWVVGMPTETRAQWLDTMGLIDWIMDVAPEARASVYRFTPYPGGPAYDMAVRGEGIAKFVPPTTMRGWGAMKLMCDNVYWCTGMCFRLDNTQKNFPGEDWQLIKPFVDLARKLWKERRPEDFPGEEVENLVEFQVRKHFGTLKAA
jgi:hypothetical protein